MILFLFLFLFEIFNCLLRVFGLFLFEFGFGFEYSILLEIFRVEFHISMNLIENKMK